MLTFNRVIIFLKAKLLKNKQEKPTKLKQKTRLLENLIEQRSRCIFRNEVGCCRRRFHRLDLGAVFPFLFLCRRSRRETRF